MYFIFKQCGTLFSKYYMICVSKWRLCMRVCCHLYSLGRGNEVRDKAIIAFSLGVGFHLYVVVVDNVFQQRL